MWPAQRGATVGMLEWTTGGVARRRRAAAGSLRRRPPWGLVLVSAFAWAGSPLGLIAPAAAQSPESDLPRPPVKDFTRAAARPVVAVPAGDTLVVRIDEQDVTVRLIGVYISRADRGAAEAQAFVSRMLAGESVYIEPDPQWPRQDADGRLWAYVYRAPDGLWLNLELVRQGFARVAAGADFEHRELLTACQRVAQRHHKGQWGRHDATPLSPTSRPAPQADERSTADGAGDETTVYVTPRGRKYHRRDCQHVRSGATAMSVEEAKKRGYTPCSRCKPPE